MATNATYKLLQKEYMRIMKNPPPFIKAKPLESDILEWHYVITGPPDSPYYNGEYHGVLLFPPDFPYKPPSIKMYTPNGRFRTDRKICLSMTNYHPENWSAAWTVSTILTGLLSFMLEDTSTAGSIRTTKREKIEYSKKSKEYNRNDPSFRLVFPELCSEEQPAETKENNENEEDDTGGYDIDNIDDMDFFIDKIDDFEDFEDFDNDDDDDGAFDTDDIDDTDETLENDSSKKEEENVSENNLMSTNEDYMIAKAMAFSMNDAIHDEEEQVASAILLSLAEANHN